MAYPWHLYLMACIYVLAGTLHLLVPGAYVRIMPKYLPNPRLLVALSGLAEILLGVGLCLPLTKDIAIYGILLMLLIYMPVHFHMLSDKKAAAGIPRWLLLLRVPLQIGLMYWAFWYLRL
ncbi:MAG: hypothetical protein AAFX53_15620 [Bacteroidota bacterium]